MEYKAHKALEHSPHSNPTTEKLSLLKSPSVTTKATPAEARTKQRQIAGEGNFCPQRSNNRRTSKE